MYNTWSKRDSEPLDYNSISPSSECQWLQYAPLPSSSAPPTSEPGWGRPAGGSESVLDAAHTALLLSTDACCQRLHWALWWEKKRVRLITDHSLCLKCLSFVVDKRLICRCTHIVTDVFPMGAFARKSLAIGFTHRTNTITGDKKLMCSRILQKTLGQLWMPSQLGLL